MSLSLTLFISLCLLLSLPPLLRFSLVVSTWWIASKWRMLWVPYFERLYLKRVANWTYFFSLHLFLQFLPLLFYPSFSPSPSPTICVTILTSIFLSLSPLSGGAGRECHGPGGRNGPDLLPPAELRRINRGHPESPPADAFLQWHKRCVCVYTVVSADKFNLSASLTFEISLLNTLARTCPHLHFTLFFLHMSSICLWRDFTLKSQITPELI